MTDELKKKLEELKIELDAYVLMSQLVFSIYHEEGEWQTPNKKWPHSDKVVYWNDVDGFGILFDEDGNFKAFNDIDFVCPITLPKFVEVIKELAPKPKAKKPAGKKFCVIYCEHGEDCLGCHRDEWRKLDGVYSTRKQAIKALEKDMDVYRKQWTDKDIGGFETDGWNIVVQDDILDASCEWDVAEL